MLQPKKGRHVDYATEAFLDWCCRSIGLLIAARLLTSVVGGEAKMRCRAENEMEEERVRGREERGQTPENGIRKERDEDTRLFARHASKSSEVFLPRSIIDNRCKTDSLVHAPCGVQTDKGQSRYWPMRTCTPKRKVRPALFLSDCEAYLSCLTVAKLLLNLVVSKISCRTYSRSILMIEVLWSPIYPIQPRKTHIRVSTYEPPWK